MITFQIIPQVEKAHNGYHYIDCYMVFDIKMKDFLRKACLVAGEHMMHTADAITYSSVVTGETVCIAITMAALYKLEAKATNVLNAYVMAPKKEKIWAVLDPEFGDDSDKSAIIVRALYGLKGECASSRVHLEQCLLE